MLQRNTEEDTNTRVFKFSTVLILHELAVMVGNRVYIDHLNKWKSDVKEGQNKNKNKKLQRWDKGEELGK